MDYKRKKLLIFISAILSFVYAAGLIAFSIISILMPEFAMKLILIPESNISLYESIRLYIFIFNLISVIFSITCGFVMLYFSGQTTAVYNKKFNTFLTFVILACFFNNIIVAILLIISLFCNDEPLKDSDITVSEKELKLKRLEELYKAKKISQQEYEEMSNRIKND